MLDYIQKLTTQLFQAYGISQDAITLQLHLQAVSLTMDSAFPCGVSFKELISNSLPEWIMGSIGPADIESGSDVYAGC
jgi:two-component sensor histidine kinase